MTFEHIEVSRHFGKMLDRALVPMGLRDALQSYPQKEVKGETGSKKKPDSGWNPARLPRGRSKEWPAVVLEVALAAKLQSGVRFWL